MTFFSTKPKLSIFALLIVVAKKQYLYFNIEVCLLLGCFFLLNQLILGASCEALFKELPKVASFKRNQDLDCWEDEVLTLLF